MQLTHQAMVADIQRFCMHDGPGIRTTVFFKGCPLRCAWCHNPETQRHSPEVLRGTGADGKAWERVVGCPQSPQRIMETVLHDRAYYGEGPGGLTISGGEPLAQAAPVGELLAMAHAEGIHTCIETCGHGSPSALEKVWPLAGLIYFDLKHLDADAHRRLTGVDNQIIISNARRLMDVGAPVEFRMPVIPGVNDGADNLRATAAFLAEMGCDRLRLVPYHPFHRDKLRWLGRPPGALRIHGDAAASLQRVKASLADLQVCVETDG